MDAADVLSSTFNGEGYDGIVLLRDIEFHSTWPEHHLQPFRGKSTCCLYSNRANCWN